MAITATLLDEERAKLAQIPFMDERKEWKYMTPFYYRWKGYWEVYSKDEYKKFMEESKDAKRQAH